MFSEIYSIIVIVFFSVLILSLLARLINHIFKKYTNRRMCSNLRVKENIRMQLDSLESKPDYDLDLLYSDALNLRDEGFKAEVQFIGEEKCVMKIPNPDFSIREANDGYEGEWCDNPEFVGEHTVFVPARLKVVRGDKL